MELVVCSKSTKGLCDNCIHHSPHARLPNCLSDCYVLDGAKCIPVKEANKLKGGRKDG